MNKQEAIERIEKLDEHYGISQGVYFKKRDVVSIISQIDEPQKPVVPKFVAEFIEECKASRRSLRDSMKGVDTPPDVNAWLLRNGREMYTYPNQETFARAWPDGYEIEPEKLYTVEIADAILTKITRGRERNVKYRMLPYKDIYKVFYDGIYANFLTETEIKQADERLWQFAVPVEEEEW